MEVSNGLIVENTRVEDKEFNEMWISSLCDSILKGKPDNELVDFLRKNLGWLCTITKNNRI